MGRPDLLVTPRKVVRPSDVARWVRENRVGVLNVAGNRESKAPGIGARLEAFLGRVFRRLAQGGTETPSAQAVE
jgi:hypothetical protein